MTTTTSQYRLIAYKNGKEDARIVGGETARDLLRGAG